MLSDRSNAKHHCTSAALTPARFLCVSSREQAEWRVEARWAPDRPLNDSELAAAKKLFFQLDEDESGSIDEYELGVMMRNLGQSPTDDELKSLIKSVDEGDCDGKIQLREFLKLYSRGLDSRGEVGSEDVNNCINAFGGDAREGAQATVVADKLREMMLAEYDLDVNLDDVFGPEFAGEVVTKKDLQSLLMPTGLDPGRLLKQAE